MILIADSGSTKTTWMDVASGNKIVTEGLNPYFTTDEAFLAACAEVGDRFSIFTQLSVYFYGAGCGSKSQCQRVTRLLSQAFVTDNVFVETDLLAACRATWGIQSGLVGVLGTGSSTCYYDNGQVAAQAPSLGYILGDHGSANHVGRILLTDYLAGDMPKEISTMFHDTYPMEKDEWIESIYRRPNANRFLASLAPFAVSHLKEDYCRDVVYHALDNWYGYQISSLIRDTHCSRLCVVGGFAEAIRPVLSVFCSDKSVALSTVVADPIEGLRQYHIKNF